MESPQSFSGNLIISEILFDPDPPVGLPSFEFAEWYNPGDDTVNLTGWQWVVGDKLRRLTGGSVNPRSYVIVCSPAAAVSFKEFGTVIALESFPALLNSGGRISLINPGGSTVHTVDYSPARFSDILKASGGWSLELVDLEGYCNPAAWQPSADPSGGTPGRVNSQRITLPAPEPPMLVRAAGYDEKSFVLLFSGNLNQDQEMNNYSCRLMPGGFYATKMQAGEYGFPGLFFSWPDGLEEDMIYTLELEGSVADCLGQEALLRPVLLGFSRSPDSSAVVISEVLFDPGAGQVEFVEVYNRSERMIELNDLILARSDTLGHVISFSDHQPLSYWLFPGSFAVFTAEAGLFSEAWPVADPAVVAEREDMPSLTNGLSELILMDRDQKILDVVRYSPDWHYPYLEESKGVSLERIDFNISGAVQTNWFSAAASSGGSTPGSKNSCLSYTPETTTEKFSFSPSAGYAANAIDPIQIGVTYNFGGPGWFMKIEIFNCAGMPVREIFPFGSVQAEGVVCWDGLDNGQRLCPDGIYLVVVDYYHPAGQKGRWKKAYAILRTY
jgi:hypothetical protein